MSVHQLTIQTPGKGLFQITSEIETLVREADLQEGLCTIMIRHTSASLTIQENADPRAKRDLEAWLERLVPEGDAIYTHTAEGPDDMPAHIKAILTATSLSIPVESSRLTLGTWQGIYVWEHRRQSSLRKLVVHFCD
ncbi:MAG: secondary thiamine-phosphate synthase enzyme YjbQ [Planctomycetota bacterium]|nr:secondary thiamine-phosphate synthase enzyme YjbQ [Planctomycetota bacterium]